MWPAISGEAQHPLRIIQVYLTFPLGETALQLGQRNSLGRRLRFYLATGMLYGMLFEWALSYFIPNSGLFGRIVFCSMLGLLIWGVNFYAILSWLQPLLFGSPLDCRFGSLVGGGADAFGVRLDNGYRLSTRSRDAGKGAGVTSGLRYLCGLFTLFGNPYGHDG